jgi:hypothetical protein
MALVIIKPPYQCAGKCGNGQICDPGMARDGYCLAPRLRAAALGQPFPRPLPHLVGTDAPPTRFFLKRKRRTIPMAKKVAKKTTVKSKAKTTAKPVAKAASDEKKPGRYTGATSGLSVKEFQNQTILANPKNKLTDTELAKSWREEFPQAAKFTEKHVASVRAAVNRGAHGNEAPANKVAEYDETGVALHIRGEKKDKPAKADAVATTEKKGKVIKLKKSA